jgi:copper chaperone CopZ
MAASLKIYLIYYFKCGPAAMAFVPVWSKFDPDWFFPEGVWTVENGSHSLQPYNQEDIMQTATLTIPAMQNEVIAIEVAKALEALNGIESVHITLAHARARVKFDEALASPLQLRSAVTAAGFVVAEAPAGGCCGGCGG